MSYAHLTSRLCKTTGSAEQMQWLRILRQSQALLNLIMCVQDLRNILKGVATKQHVKLRETGTQGTPSVLTCIAVGPQNTSERKK